MWCRIFQVAATMLLAVAAVGNVAVGDFSIVVMAVAAIALVILI